MSARPGNWSLITDDGKDPVAGDPAAVHSQVTYYTDMAKTIMDEAHRLKSLGQDDQLVGKYKKSLEKELGELADDVHNAHKRYDGVATALKPFAGALDDARTESWGALQDAIKANSAQTSANGMPNPQPKDGKPLTAAQKTDQTNRATAIKNASDDLGKAKARLHTALSDLQKAGKKAKDIINDHDHDALRDHHHWYDVVVKIIKVIVEIANYVVIVLAIVALFIPGLDLIVLAISAAILLADIGLAATGNGSWLDVAFDVVALVTFGAGRGLEKAGERGAETAMKSATKAAVKTEFRNSGNIIARNFVNRGAKMARAVETGTREVSEFANTFKSTVKLSAKEMARSGGLQELGKSSKLVDALGTKFGGASVFRNTYMAGLRAGGKATWAAGVAAPLTNTALSGSNLPGLENNKPHLQSWDDTKENFLPNFHLPNMKASEYNWNDHPAMKSAVSNIVYGPGIAAGAGLNG